MTPVAILQSSRREAEQILRVGLILAALAVIVLAGFVALVVIRMPPSVRFSNGSTLRICAITTGTNHSASLSFLAKFPASVRNKPPLDRWIGDRFGPFGYPNFTGTVLWSEIHNKFLTNAPPSIIAVQDGSHGPTNWLKTPWNEDFAVARFMGSFRGAFARGPFILTNRELGVTVYETPAPGQTNLLASFWMHKP